MIGANSFKARKPHVPHFLTIPWGIRDVLVFILGWFGLQALAVFILVAGALFDPGIRAMVEGLQGSNIVATFSVDVITAVLGLGLVMLVIRKYRASWRELGWRKFNVFKALVYLIVTFIVVIALANLLLYLAGTFIPGFNANEEQATSYAGVMGWSRNLAIIALVLVPAMLEETIFRGFIFPAVSKKWGIIAGAIISSVLFSLAHGQANISLYTLPLGLFLCFMYVRLGSIVPGVLLHMLNNYLAFLALTSAK